jgi:DeoR/GlpR family transcriptional regulator of sugar metabolism/transposase
MADSGAAGTQTRLSGDDREVLARWARGSSRQAVRAAIVLACSEPGAADARVAAALGVSRPTVASWRRRFAQAGLVGLADAARRGRPKAALDLTGAERAQLTRWARRGSTAQTLALRARIVLVCAAGTGNKETAVQLHVTEAMVARWRARFLADRLVGLADQPRPGRPPSSPRQKAAPDVKKHLTAISGPRSHDTGPATAQDDRLAIVTPPGSQADPAVHHARPAGPSLLAAERRDLLLTWLHRDGKLVAKDLATELGLSDDSIRRDLRDLAAAGLCQRVYGGALPVSPALGPHATRSRIAPESKRRVAAAAAALITPGSTVILDGGTTAVEAAKALPRDLEATIITRSAPVAATLADHPAITVHMLTGQLDKESLSTTGATAAEAASTVIADLALITAPGVHPHHGLTAAWPEDAAMKRILARRAPVTYVIASAEKLGTVCPCAITGLSEITGIITDAPGHPAVRQLRDQGVTIVEASGNVSGGLP